MAKVKTVTKKLKKTDSYEYTPKDKGANYSYNIYACAKGNEIHDASGKDYLYGGNGNDILVAGKGNDTLSGGKGVNTLVISGEESGNDTVILGSGTDNLTFDTSDTFAYSKSGNNLIINHNNGKVTVKDYFKYGNGKASLKTLNGNDLNTLINAEGLTLNNVTSKDKTITGTYLNDVIIAQGSTKNTITTGKGNDTIDAGLGADTITIDAAGEKTIKIKKGDGNDTIAFTSKGLNAKVILAFDYDQDSPDFAGYSFNKSGNNLIISRSWLQEDESIFTEKTTIQDYFKNNLDIVVKKDSSNEEFALSEFINNVIINGNAAKENSLAGTKYDDYINGGKLADKISTGSGVDTVWGLKGNDKITINGTGDKNIYISRDDGNDTIVFDLDKVIVDEKINVKILLEDLYESPAQTTYNIDKNQQDLIIKNKYEAVAGHKAVNQTITIKNYFGNTDKINLTVDGDDVYAALLEHKGDVIVSGTTITGTPFDDEITGTNKADTIYGYAGNDVIKATKGNDKIYGGDGNDKYIYDGFTHYEEKQTANLGHDTIYNSGGTDTISILGIEDNYTMANYFEPNIVHEISRVYPSYVDNQFYARPHWFKNGNDLILSTSSDWKSKETNTITLKDYFKYGKDGFGVKYVDNGEEEYIEDEWLGYWNDENEWVAQFVKNEDYQKINILDNAALCFDGNYTPEVISWAKANNFTGTFMNDIIRGNSNPDILRGGDGNDILYGNFANGKEKDKLYGDAGNDIIFASDTKAYGGTGNDIFVSDFLDGSDIISDEAGYDRLSLRNRKYLTYFDVTQKNGNVVSKGDIYIKDVTAGLTPIRIPSQSYRVLDLDAEGNLQIYDDWEHDGLNYGSPKYKYSDTKVDEVVARYVGRPVFEVSDAYYERLKDDITLLENFNDYGDEKTYLDGYALQYYVPREGYKLVYAAWDFYVKDVQYENFGFETTALDKYENSTTAIYNTNSVYNTNNNVVGYGGEATQYQGKTYYSKTLYDLSSSSIKVNGIRTILQNKEAGVVIKNGTTQATAIETISLDRGAEDTTTLGVSGKEDNLMIGDYSQEKVDRVASAVAKKLYQFGFSSMQDAISKGSNAQLTELLDLFEGTYEWTENVKFRRGLYADAESDFGGTITGTAIIEDNDILGPVMDSSYELSFTNEDRASMISDYSGDDKLTLDYNENGYSFLFDVEVDKKGNLLNYSRDFYVKFAGEEAENTGVTICYGREQRHAIEVINMKYEGSDSPYEQNMETGYISENRLFTYNQDVIDEVRQNVAGWLTDNGYSSVQDVLYSKDADVIAEMMTQFAPINNNLV